MTVPTCTADGISVTRSRVTGYRYISHNWCCSDAVYHTDDRVEWTDNVDLHVETVTMLQLWMTTLNSQVNTWLNYQVTKLHVDTDEWTGETAECTCDSHATGNTWRTVDTIDGTVEDSGDRSRAVNRKLRAAVWWLGVRRTIITSLCYTD